MSSAWLRLTLYSRSECCLCDRMKDIVARVARDVPLQVEEVDIAIDPDLERRYGELIPVLELDGKEIARYRVTEAVLRRILGDHLR